MESATSSATTFIEVRSRRHPEPHQHRQECLCHTGSGLHQQSYKFGRINVAQTLLSVLWQLAAPYIGNPMPYGRSLIVGSPKRIHDLRTSGSDAANFARATA